MELAARGGEMLNSGVNLNTLQVCPALTSLATGIEIRPNAELFAEEQFQSQTSRRANAQTCSMDHDRMAACRATGRCCLALWYFGDECPLSGR